MLVPGVEITLMELKRICKENPEIKYFYITHVREGKIEVEWESPMVKVNIPGDGGSPLCSLPIGESFRCNSDDVEIRNFISAFMELCLGKDVTVAPFAKLAPSSHSQVPIVDTVIAELKHRLKGKEKKPFYIYHDKLGDISFSCTQIAETVHAAINGRVGLANLPKGEGFQCTVADLTNKIFIEELGKLIEGKHVSYHIGRLVSSTKLPKEPIGGFGINDVYRVVSFFNPGVNKESIQTLLELIKSERNN